MNSDIGVWIDHARAVIVIAGEHTTRIVPSDVPGHTRFTGGGGYPGSDSSQRGASEKRREERHRNALDHYFDTVIAALGHPQALFVFGPGEAKQQLVARLERSRIRPRPAIAVETADKLTDAQVVEAVTTHFASSRALPRG